MANELLSIHIPTFNRARYIAELLPALITQIKNFGLQNKILIKVFDNASTDETSNICRGFGANIQYQKNQCNIGADANIIEAYASSKTPYVWVLGDDELAVKNSLQRIIFELETASPSMIILNDGQYNRLGYFPVVFKNYVNFFQFALNANPHFLIAHSLISINIVRSTAFNAKLAKTLLAQSYYPHFTGLIDGVISDGQLLIVHESKTLHVRKKRAQIDNFDPSKGGICNNLSANISRSQVEYMRWLRNRCRLMNSDFKIFSQPSLDIRPEEITSWHAMRCRQSPNSQNKLLRSFAKRCKTITSLIDRFRFNTQCGLTDLRKPNSSMYSDES